MLSGKQPIDSEIDSAFSNLGLLPFERKINRGVSLVMGYYKVKFEHNLLIPTRVIILKQICKQSSPVTLASDLLTHLVTSH